jgi:hypothetical protein
VLVYAPSRTKPSAATAHFETQHFGASASSTADTAATCTTATNASCMAMSTTTSSIPVLTLTAATVHNANTTQAVLMKPALTQRRRQLDGCPEHTNQALLLQRASANNHSRVQSSILSQYGEIGSAARLLRIYDDYAEGTTAGSTGGRNSGAPNSPDTPAFGAGV